MPENKKKRYLNSEGVLMGPVKNKDGTYTLPKNSDGTPVVNLKELEITPDSHKDTYDTPLNYYKNLGKGIFNSAMELMGLGYPSNVNQGKYLEDGSFYPASGRIDNSGHDIGVGFVGNVLKGKNLGRLKGNTPKNIPTASSVDDVGRSLTQAPKPAWQMEELPGLHLKSTMEGQAISKIVEPKTGLINVEQALGIIGKESGGADKVALIKQGLGDNIPKKMDFNEFRKTVQDQLIPLERQFSEHASNYGIDRLGYGKYKTVINERGNPILQPLKGKNLEPLENQTLILGNKGKFGRGSGAHGNPDETLGHIHFLRDAETPDVLTVTQIQSDAFQGTHRIMPKNAPDVSKSQFSLQRMEEIQNRNKAVLNKMKTEGVDEAGVPVQDYQIKQFEDIVKAQEQSNLLKKAELENFSQKSLLDKNHQERYLQELVDYAGKRGDVNKVRVPTSETAAKVQGYRKSIPTHLDDNLQPVGGGEYSKEHQTILKKYSEQPKTIKKLFGEEPKIVTDSKGNTWYEFDIPKKFKEGKGEIKALSAVGVVGTGAVIQNQSDNNKKEFQYGGYMNKIKKRKLFNGGQLIKNAANSFIDTPLSMLGLSEVIPDDAYEGTGANFTKGWANNVGGKVGKTLLPIAANIVAPGSGMAVAAVQQGLSTMNPEAKTPLNKINNPTQANYQMAMGGQMNIHEVEGPPHEQGGVTINSEDEVEGKEFIINKPNKNPIVVSNKLGIGGKSYAKIINKAKNQGSELRPNKENDMFSKSRIQKVVDYVTAMNLADVEALGIPNGTQEMKYGGKIKYRKGGEFKDKFKPYSPSASDEIVDLPGFEKPERNFTYSDIGMNDPQDFDDLQIQSLNNYQQSKKFNPINTESDLGKMSTMDYVNLGTNLAGTIYDFTSNRKVQPVNYDRVKSRMVNMEPQIVNIRDDANTAINSAAYDIRTNSPTAGSYLANRTSLGVKGAKGIAKTLADLRMKQEIANTEMLNIDTYTNAEIAIKEAQDAAANLGQVLSNRSQAFRNLSNNTASLAKMKNQEKMNVLIGENLGTSQVKWVGNKPYINVNGKWVPYQS